MERRCKMCKVLNVIAMILVFIGGLNWGLVGFFNFDIVATIFGYWANIVYAIVGLAALYGIIWSFTGHCACGCCHDEKPKKKKK